VTSTDDTTTETRMTYLGVPFVSEVNPSGHRRTPQRPIEELEPLLIAVLQDPVISAFGWTQYTPYFNDGEPCIFSVGTPWFTTVGGRQPDEEDERGWGFEEDSFTISHHPTLGHQPSRFGYVADVYQRTWEGEYVGEHEQSWKRCRALSDAIESEAFDDALLAKFGDHAQVVIRPSGITVSDYSHD
jgi:hypothetical protein